MLFCQIAEEHNARYQRTCRIVTKASFQPPQTRPAEALHL